MGKKFIVYFIGFCASILLMACQTEETDSDLKFPEEAAGTGWADEDPAEPERQLDQDYLNYLLAAAEQFETSGDDFGAHQMGDDFPHNMFLYGPYETKTIEELPIPIYLAYFSVAEEQEIIEGIAIANRAIGYDVFELVDEWEPQARIIYKVNEINDTYDKAKYSSGEVTTGLWGYTMKKTITTGDQNYAGTVVTDWMIELKAGTVSRWLVAHELGHAMGLYHCLIDYEADTCTELPAQSVMDPIVWATPQTEDYYLMMREQGELLLDYLQDPS